MLYLSLWTWYGIALMLIYVTLAWCGYFAKRKRHRGKSNEMRDSATLQRHYTSEKVQNLDQRSVKHSANKERFEDVASSRASSGEDTSGLRRRLIQDVVIGDENVVVAEEIVETVQSEEGLESQNFDLEAVDSTIAVVLEHFCSNQAAKIIENGLLSVYCERFAPAETRESISELSRSGCIEREEQDTSVRFFSDFAEELVRNTTEDAFRHFKQATANEFARNLSSQVILEAFAEIRDDNTSNCFTECEDNCRAEDLDKSTFQNIQIFAQDFSEKLLNEGVDAVVMKEAEIAKVDKYSDNFVSCIIMDGVAAAGAHCKPAELSGADKSIPELSTIISPISEHAEHLTNELCQVAYQEVVLLTSLQSSVTGVVENLVNGAITEAVTKVKEETSDEQEAMKKLGAEAPKHEIINSNLSDTKQNVKATAAEGDFIEAMNVAQLSHMESENTVDDKVLNGHNGVSQPEISVANDVQSVCSSGQQDSVSRRTPNSTKGPEGVCDEYENGSQSKRSGFWRQSLLIDLEEDVDYDDNSSEASGENAPDKLRHLSHDHDSSDEESEEFIDSSEDEIIDHAEEATLGAVGGTHKPAPKWEEEEDFEPEEMVDGLCMSRPHKHRKQSLPRPRVQSAGSHFNQAVVLDNGSGIIKLGLAGDRKPTVIQSAVVGTPQRYSLQMTAMDHKKHLKYGDVAMAAAGVMHLDYPMNAGKIENWTDIEDLWEYLLYDNLGIEEASHPVLITEVADNHPKNREKIAEILFEHLSVPAMYLVNQLSLSLYASGLTTGVCLSSGFSVTQAAAIYEGYVLKHSIQQLDIAGQGLTDNMKQLLRDNRGHNFPSSSGWQIVNSMKEHLAYVSKDFAAEMKQYKTNAGLTKQYKLPDGQMVDVHSEQIQSVEPLFAPNTLLSANDTVAAQSPIHKLIHNAIRRCDPEVQDMCYRNIVLSGGSTTLPGLVPRLEHELVRINPKIRKIRAPEKRDLSPWIGGSILASLSTFDSMYVTVDEYADSGPRIVNKKCF